MNVELTRSALLDRREIIRWYENQGNRAAGEALVGSLLVRIGQLDSFPESGRILPEFQLQELRELIEPSSRIVNRITERSLTVIRIWRGERQLALPG